MGLIVRICIERRDNMIGYLYHEESAVLQNRTYGQNVRYIFVQRQEAETKMPNANKTEWIYSQSFMSAIRI